jgi:repressor LexA
MEPLTQKQRKVLTFIEEHLKGKNPPSQREIAEHFNLAQNAVYQLIGYLKKKGYLVDSGGHRGLRLSGEYLGRIKQTDGIPVIGRVAAGEPILAQEHIEGYVNFERLFNKSDGVFLLKVSGDSMIDDGLMDGDYVVVDPSAKVENGRIGVVLLDDEATVKRVYIRKGKVALKPANRRAGYKIRYVKQFDRDVRIIGKVTGCIRTDIR